MNTGPQNSLSVAIANPLPLSWLGRADAPLSFPAWANIGRLTPAEIRNYMEL